MFIVFVLFNEQSIANICVFYLICLFVKFWMKFWIFLQKLYETINVAIALRIKSERVNKMENDLFKFEEYWKGKWKNHMQNWEATKELDKV